MAKSALSGSMMMEALAGGSSSNVASSSHPSSDGAGEATRAPGDTAPPVTISQQSCATAGEAQRHGQRFFNGGYELSCSDGPPVIVYELPNGEKWRKKIWPRAAYPSKLHRYCSVEEILSYLISFDKHQQWACDTPRIEPESGTILFYSKQKTKQYRSDGYEWKKRTGTASVREDRLKLKVCGQKLLYACYTHSASNPNFHRRSYWLIQNPDFIMVHYLETDKSQSSPVATTREEIEAAIPSSTDLLTVSDVKLCYLLGGIKNQRDMATFLATLAAILRNNSLALQSMAEAIEANDAMIPTLQKPQHQHSLVSKDELKTGGRSNNASESNAQRQCSTSGVGLCSDLLIRELSSIIQKKTESLASYPAVKLEGTLESLFQNMDSFKKDAVNPSVSTSASDPASRGSKGVDRAPMPSNCVPMATRKPPLEGKRATGSPSSPDVDYDANTFSAFAKSLSTLNPSTPWCSRGSKDAMSCDKPCCTSNGKAGSQGRMGLEDPVPMDLHLNKKPADTRDHQQSLSLTSDQQFSSYEDAVKKSSPLPLQRASAMSNITGDTVSSGVDLGPVQVASSGTDGRPSLQACGDSQMDVHVPASSLLGTGVHSTAVPEGVTTNQRWGYVSEHGLHNSAGSVLGTAHDQGAQRRSDIVDSDLDTSLDFLLSETTFDPASEPDSDGVQWLQEWQASPALDSTTREAASLNKLLCHDSPRMSPPVSRAPWNAARVPHTSSTKGSHLAAGFVEGAHARSPTAHQHQHQEDVSDSQISCGGLRRSSTSDSLGAWLEDALISEQKRLSVQQLPVQQGRHQQQLPPLQNNPFPGDDSSGYPYQQSSQFSEQYLTGHHQPSGFHQHFTDLQAQPSSSTHHHIPDCHHHHQHQHLHQQQNHPPQYHQQQQQQVHLQPDQQLPGPQAQMEVPQHYHHHSKIVQQLQMQEQQATGNAYSQGISNLPMPNTSAQPPLPLENDQEDFLLALQDPFQQLDSGSSRNQQVFDSVSQAPISDVVISITSPDTTQLLNADVENSRSLQVQPRSPSLSPQMSPSNWSSSSELFGSPLEDILEEVAMDVGGPSTSFEDRLLRDSEPFSQYRTSPSAPSSPSLASVSSLSTLSVHGSLFDAAGSSPSILELCELLGESQNVRHNDFSHLTLSESEQKEVFSAAITIQSAFRKHRAHRKEKRAALVIESYYKQYREIKRMKERAAKTIQTQYRLYKRRVHELDRAALFIQQMYRYRKQQNRPKRNH